MSITVGGSTITMANGAVISAPSGTAPLYLYRAWVKFNQAGSTVTASGNVSSVGDLGVGLSSINFTTAMIDANYAVASAGENNVGTVDGAYQGPSTYFLAAGSFNIACASNSNTRGSDWQTVSLIVIR